MSRPALLSKGLLVVGLAGFAILAIALAVHPKMLLQGWLIAIVFLSGIPLGSLSLLLIHRLTGGQWGSAFDPILTAAALATPLLIVLFLPILLDLSALYPWAADPSVLRKPVAQLYLNQPAFMVRSMIALVGWSVFALCVVRRGGGTLLAAAGLVFHGAAMSFIAVDWVLSIDSAFSSSAFAAAMVVQQMLSALAFAAFAGSANLEMGPTEDLGALIMTTLLGAFYLDFMSYVVIWYGNLPEKAAWYLARGRGGWQWLLIAIVLVGLFVPFCLLLARRCRQSRFALRAVGMLVLLGVFLHVLWLIAPVFDLGAIAVSVVAVVALMSLAVATGEWISLRLGAAYAE